MEGRLRKPQEGWTTKQSKSGAGLSSAASQGPREDPQGEVLHICTIRTLPIRVSPCGMYMGKGPQIMLSLGPDLFTWLVMRVV